MARQAVPKQYDGLRVVEGRGLKVRGGERERSGSRGKEGEGGLRCNAAVSQAVWQEACD